jgi:chemotaxis protein methyltransferase CheR
MNSNKDNKTLSCSEREIQDIELSLLIEAIYCRWGYDFHDYARASLKRRVLRVIEMERLNSISALQELILRDTYSMQRFLDAVTVGYTSMFRDPTFYKAFRRVVVPILQEYKRLRIWHVGCASGEEVYSLAILLQEEGLLHRTRIYATDVNQRLLEIGRSGVYPLDRMKDYTKNYQASGGHASFSEYYYVNDGHVTMYPDLTKDVVWAQHNLVTDSSFNEFHLVLCRNVLFYFNEFLQERIHRLIYDSLMPGGFLVLGHQEILMAPYITDYISLDRNEKIYKKIH